MGRIFEPSRVRGGGVAEVQSMYYATGQAFKKGAVLTMNASGEVIEASADPTSILGVALEGAGTKPGYDSANSPTVVTGRLQEVSIALANRNTMFIGRGVNGGTDPVLPLQTHIDELYGLAKVVNDWVIDLAEVTTTSIEIVDFEADRSIFFFKFQESRLLRP